jgi:hypothetical protein
MSVPSTVLQSLFSNDVSNRLKLYRAPTQAPLYANQFVNSIRMYEYTKDFSFAVTGSVSAESDDEFMAAILDDPTFLARWVKNMKIVADEPTEFEQPTRTLDDTNATSFEGATVTLESLQFCGTHGLMGHLSEGIKMARKYFSSMADIEARLEFDLEDHDQYVVLLVNSPRDASIDLEAYLKYCEDWSASVAWPMSRMILLDFNSATADNRYGI